MVKTDASVGKVLILGSGGLRIGQAGEFDYSGSQAIKALKEEGVRTVLVNPNIATVQTDPAMADEVYFYPLTLPIVTKIIEKERPDGILLGFGGQTALNLGLALEEQNILDHFGVRVLGTAVRSIRKSEDREQFKGELSKIDVKSPRSFCVTHIQDALSAAEEIGYPVMVRSGFTLGGLGSGRANSKSELIKRISIALAVAPHALIEEYLIGWKEVEYEVIRDCAGNGVTVCNMENFDPMGIHTGESIVVAPSQTLNNAEYQFFRRLSLDIANLFEITGECNIQYALNAKTGDYRAIEMNARLSRSSALASKATGYPLAFVAAKLALGRKLYDIKNTITEKTSAFFEPALDYLVVKIPRWDTKKLPFTEKEIGTEMKSVGEVMAIGRTLPEAIQKAVQMLNIGRDGLSDPSLDHTLEEMARIEKEIENPTDCRLFALYAFFREGGSVEQAAALSHIDPWFLAQIASIASMEEEIIDGELTPHLLVEAKKMGFSDKAIARIKEIDEETVREMRVAAGITPVVKQIDTLAGEFEAKTNYFYMTYHGVEHDAVPSPHRPVIILGSGPYCIGSSVEFDWCAVNTARTLDKLGFESVMINSNPETVSTDYDESDRLYFEVLSLERVQDIADFEQSQGIIVSVGGQIANNLALPLSAGGYPIIGTDPTSIDQAENREKFSSLLRTLNVDQPPWKQITNLEEAQDFARNVGYPVLVRPSYVLSGAAMSVASDDREMEECLSRAFATSPTFPVVLSQFIEEGKEIEADGVAQSGDLIVLAISEHIEHAGVHSGDATIVLPPQHLYVETVRQIKKMTRKIVRALCITGPFNIQFIAKNHTIKIIECNLRASRSLPFASKTTGHNFIEIATSVLMDRYQHREYETLDLDYVGVKSPLFSYQRLKGANPVARVEMASTGEVACLGEDLYEAFFHAYLAAEQNITGKQILFSVFDSYKHKFLGLIKELVKGGFQICSTEGTHTFLRAHGVESTHVYKASQPIEPNITTLITQRRYNLIVNIPQRFGKHNKTDGYTIRRLAIDHQIPLVTNAQLAMVLLDCLVKRESYITSLTSCTVKSWREFLERKRTYLPPYQRSEMTYCASGIT